jgi:succinoglycan biosynthesis protein ExoA
MSKPFVSILIPTLNEEHYVESAIRTLLPEPGDLDCEVLVLDGGSRDATVRIVEALASQDGRIRLVHNPKRLQAAAINLGAEIADPRARTFVRADCHARYPEDFVRKLVSSLATTGATSVVVPMRTVGITCRQRAIAAAQNSRLGNGGSIHRVGSHSQWVEHGHHAAFDRSFFQATGGYDETFSHNEDAEYDKRSHQAGGKVWLQGDLAIDYYPRATVRALAKQYANHGAGRAKTILKHGEVPSLRQLGPVMLFAACAGSLALAPVKPLLLLVPLSYLVVCAVLGAVVSTKAKSLCASPSGLMAATMHMSWAFGFIRTCLRHSRAKR